MAEFFGPMTRGGKGFYTGAPLFQRGPSGIIKLTGFKELYNALQKLPQLVREKIMNKSMGEGCKIILQAAKAKAPRGSGLYKGKSKGGHLADAMYVSRAKWDFGNITLGLAIRRNQGFMAHWIEFGTGLFYTGTGKSVRKPYRIPKESKKGVIAFPAKWGSLGGPSYKSFLTKSEGAFAQSMSGGSNYQILHHAYHPGIRPRPFIRPAFDENVQGVINKIGIVTKTEIEKEFEKRTLRWAA